MTINKITEAVSAVVSGAISPVATDLASVAAMRVEQATNSAVNFSQGVLFTSLAKEAILKALDGADFPVYESVREIWVKAYASEREVKREIAVNQWGRMVKEFAIEKPKSTSAEAVQKDAKREEEKQRLAKMTADELSTAKSDAMKLAETGIKTGDIKVSKSAMATVEKLDAEAVRRHKEANKDQEDILSKKRAHIVGLLKLANLETLTKIEALLGSVSSNQPDGKAITDAATAPLVKVAA